MDNPKHAPASLCNHQWLPQPSDAQSALVLVGHAQCLRCGRSATRDDMVAFKPVTRIDEMSGRVISDYDPFGG